MASDSRETVVRGLDRVFNQGTLTGLSESELLGQCATWGDEVAFEALVTRHGPKVLGVGRPGA